MIFVSQLPKAKQFALYKIIKAQLIEADLFSYENLVSVMDNKLKDFPYDVQGVVM